MTRINLSLLTKQSCNKQYEGSLHVVLILIHVVGYNNNVHIL